MNAEIFWAQFNVYNEVTLPVQVILVITAVILTYLTFAKLGTKPEMWMKV